MSDITPKKTWGSLINESLQMEKTKKTESELIAKFTAAVEEKFKTLEEKRDHLITMADERMSEAEWEAQAGDLHKKFVRIRTGAEAIRRALKTPFDKLGKIIKAKEKEIIASTEAIEAKLYEISHKKEIERKNLVEERKISRTKEFEEVARGTTFSTRIPANIWEMEEYIWQATIEAARKQAKEERDEKPCLLVGELHIALEEASEQGKKNALMAMIMIEKDLITEFFPEISEKVDEIWDYLTGKK